MLFDAHTHLNFEENTEEKIRNLGSEIEHSEVSFIIDVGDSVESSLRAIENSHKFNWCYAAVGIHPEYAKSTDIDDFNKIKKLLKNEKVKAVGEIGLDFHYGKESKEKQEYWFRKQLCLALEEEMPIMIHTRDADGITMDILKQEGAFSKERLDKFKKRRVFDLGDKPEDLGEKSDARVQLHCFSGSVELAKEYVNLGATISIGGPVTFKNGKKTARVAKETPISALLSETDAPFLTPEPFRGKENKSIYIEHIVRRIAIIKNIDYKICADVLLENGKRFFNIGD